jgi:hypothetical protein
MFRFSHSTVAVQIADKYKAHAHFWKTQGRRKLVWNLGLRPVQWYCV